MSSEAQRKATKKYDESNTKMFTLKVNKKTEKDIYNHLTNTKNVNGYIKGLIREDIKKQ